MHHYLTYSILSRLLPFTVNHCFPVSLQASDKSFPTWYFHRTTFYKMPPDKMPRVKSAHSLTHSLTATLDQLTVVASSTSNDPGPAAPTDRPMSSSTCCIQFLRGRPGGRFQSAAGGVPVWASIDSCSACEAGVFSGRRQM